jgi:hypothetical protein
MTLLLGTAWILFVISCLVSMAPPLQPHPKAKQASLRSRPARSAARPPATEVLAASVGSSAGAARPKSVRPLRGNFDETS